MIEDIRWLQIANGDFNPSKHGNAISPFKDWPFVYVLQVRTEETGREWVSVPVIPLPKEKNNV